MKKISMTLCAIIFAICAISAQNQEHTALAMAKSMLYRGCAPEWQETMKRIEQTTTRQLQDVAQELLNPSSAYILTYE